ncbi:MAG: glucose-6-phosphate isomerase [Hyphomicrobiaceae bacterium]
MTSPTLAKPLDRAQDTAIAGLPYPYRQTLEGCCAAHLGRDDLAGIPDDQLKTRFQDAVARMREAHASRSHPILNAAYLEDDLPLAEAALARLSKGARTIVFFGTGGSSLGGQTLAQVGGWNIPGDRGVAAGPSRSDRRPRARFYDNLDGRTLGRALDQFDLETTRFVVTSKSGNTPETLTQAVAAIEAVVSAGLEARIPDLFLAVTEPEVATAGNGLRRLCARYGIACLDHPTTIGGRYSVLSVVGMLPGLARGMDGREIRAGARAVADALMTEDPLSYAPAAGALAIAGLQQQGGVRAFVMMPYCDRLGRLAHWYTQLFGESLGKDGLGGTPVAALGPVDQHSQLQLWMDGPREHMVTFVRERSSEGGPTLSKDLAALAGIEYLAGRTVGALVAAQSEAVPEALRQAGRPHRIFDVDNVDGRTIGGLMMHFMIETILLGDLMGVDPFDQPAVETGKRLARDLLKRAE